MLTCRTASKMSADLQWMLIRNNSCFLVKSLGKTLTKVFVVNCLTLLTLELKIILSLKHFWSLAKTCSIGAEHYSFFSLRAAIGQLCIP